VCVPRHLCRRFLVLHPFTILSILLCPHPLPIHPSRTCRRTTTSLWLRVSCAPIHRHHFHLDRLSRRPAAGTGPCSHSIRSLCTLDDNRRYFVSSHLIVYWYHLIYVLPYDIFYAPCHELSVRSTLYFTTSSSSVRASFSSASFC